MRCPTMRPTASRSRRGLTLVELLVSIALMLVVMSIIVAVFTAATGAMTAAKRDQELGSVARRLEGLIQQDLRGATARFTPPLDPADDLGYFEYGENSSADIQDEDTDDYLAFTVRAPAGQPFTGRIMLPRGRWPATVPLAGQIRYAPTTITSDTAEVIYFLRHGNLYRRVLLVLPNQRLSADIINNQFRFQGAGSDGFSLSGANLPEVSWQGANDISVRPSNSIAAFNDSPPIPNSLGDLTNRHNRAFRPGFIDDMDQDGAADDNNNDGVADYYPTLYPNNLPRPFRGGLPSDNNDTLAFPFVFPVAYSTPRPHQNPGAIHAGPLTLYLNNQDGTTTRPPPPSVLNLKEGNHSPLQTGDNLIGDAAAPEINWSLQSGWTFWGFPTWAETRNINWNAANKRINFGEFNRGQYLQAYGLSWVNSLSGNPNWLPPQNHWYTDSIGNPALTPPDQSWQDDLIATNVRSFDVKALDPNAGDYTSHPDVGRNFTVDYYDLGYAYNLKLPFDGTVVTPLYNEVQTFGHEGRIPPLVADNRIDYQMQQRFNASPLNSAHQTLYGLGDNNANTVRLRRVWDSWSTDYAFAPMKNINPGNFPPNVNAQGFYLPPLYPSYPPPYPQPLRGIQIQIRLTNPEQTQLKVLTIRQDFTDKL